MEQPQEPKRKATPKSAAEDIAIEQRRQEAIKLRVRGWSIREIAAELKCGSTTVHRDIEAVLERTRDKTDGVAERERQIVLERLDVATKNLWKKVEEGDLEAIDRLVKLEARRAKMLGFDAPVRNEHTGPDGAPIPIAAVDALSTKLDGLRKRIVGGTAGEQTDSGTAGVSPEPDGR